MKKNYHKFLTILMVMSAFILVSSAPPDLGVKKVLERLKLYNKHQPQEKVYLQLDKPVYAAGEDLWFKAYILNASNHNFDTLSRILYVELLSPEQKVVKRKILYNKSGWANGDLALEESLVEGNYVIRAYTNYMKNLGEEFFFVKEIMILNPRNIDSHHPTAEQNIDLQFFPEGGNLLMGVENRVAFKAINNLGRGVDIEGLILDEKENRIGTFKSVHNGMGVIKIKPEPGKKYKAKILKHFNVEPIYEFPDASESSFSLGISEEGENVRILIQSNDRKIHSSPKHFAMVFQSRGVAYLSGQGEMKENSYSTLVPKTKFPTGIIQATLFDSAMVPQCERLFFVNHKDNLDIQIKTDKISYGPREKVNLEIEAKDHLGKPVSGNFSMTIFDEEKVKGKDRFSADIVSHLLLSSDLRGIVEDPSYYFKDTLKETRDKLDLLMMTHGWRRFIWKEILKDSLPTIKYFPEKGIPVSGQVFKKNKPAGGSQVKIAGPGSGIVVMKTNEEGKFYLDNFVFNDSSDIYIQTRNPGGVEANYKLVPDAFNSSPPSTYIPSPGFKSEELVDFWALSEKRKEALKVYKTIDLNEVVVEGKKVKEKEPFRYYTPNRVIKMSDMNLSSQIPMDYIVSSLRPHMFRSSFSGSDPLVLLDGVEIDYKILSAQNSTVNPQDIEYIDIIYFSNATAFGARGFNGVIYIHTKKGAANNSLSGIGVNIVKSPGISKARAFYSPKYEGVSESRHIPDIRATLLWEPTFITDKDGKAKITFYTSDILSRYKIVVEGVSENGIPGTQTGEVNVQGN